MFEFYFIVFIIGSGISSAIIAKNKDRDVIGWFMIGVILGIFGIIIAAAVPKVTDNNLLTKNKYKQCLYCSEVIFSTAIKCPYCQSELPETEETKNDDNKNQIPHHHLLEIEDHLEKTYDIQKNDIKHINRKGEFLYKVETENRILEIEVGGFEIKSKVI